MTSQTLYDVAIVGGGLAGLSLAIQCADANVRVILFEKENYPFHKVCGEYISLESFEFLQRLGVDVQTSNLPIIKKLEVSDSKGENFSFKLLLGGVGISRFLLDSTLYEIAVAKGVNVCTNTKVTGITFQNETFTVIAGETRINAKIAIAAYGKRSNLDIKWKRSFTLNKRSSLTNYVGIKYHVRYSHASDVIALHNFKNGYCGISKIEDGKSCLCYLTTAANLRSCSNSIDEMQQRILFKNPLLKEIFCRAEFLYKEPLAISQISFEKKSLVENHVFMAGDAAGMITPLCGNGMSMAMRSSAILFNCLNRFLVKKASREEVEKAYKTEWRAEFSRRLWIGRNVQRAFGGDASTSVFLKAMHLIPPVARLIIKATHGRPF